MDVAQTFIAEKLPKDATDEIKARRVNAFYAKVAIPAIRIFREATTPRPVLNIDYVYIRD